MTTQAAIGHRNLFQILADVGSPPTEAWFTVGEVGAITPPQLSRDAPEATHTESPGGWREFIPGLKDGGEMSCELNFVANSDTTRILLDTFDSDELQRVRILFADGDQDSSPITCSSFTCSGVVTGLPIEAPLDDKMTATLTVKISGEPVFVAGAA